MKPCKICQQPKTYHDWSFVNYTTNGHKFEMDNLLWLEKKVKAKEAADKRRALNFCQICGYTKKTPFGICKECSAMLIAERLVCAK